MSAIFEGILLLRPSIDEPGFAVEKFCESRVGGARVGYIALDDAISVIARTDGRNAPFSEKFERLASMLSSTLGRALVVRYDSRVGHRSSSYFENGIEIAEYGEDDEILSPLNEDGSVSGEWISPDQAEESEEYGMVKNAIELGLEKFGAGNWDDVRFMIYNQGELL